MQHPEAAPGKSDPHDTADREDFDVFAPNEATAKHSDRESSDTDPAFWGRSPVEPATGDMNREETFNDDMMPDDPDVPDRFMENVPERYAKDGDAE